MNDIHLQCGKCTKIFPMPNLVSGNATVTFRGSKVSCPNCGSLESIPDMSFKTSVEGVISELTLADNPLQEAKILLSNLEAIRSGGEKSVPAKYKKWLPNTPEKVAAYIAIAYTIVQLLSNSPKTEIKYEMFINEYNNYVNSSEQK